MSGFDVTGIHIQGLHQRYDTRNEVDTHLEQALSDLNLTKSIQTRSIANFILEKAKLGLDKLDEYLSSTTALSQDQRDKILAAYELDIAEASATDGGTEGVDQEADAPTSAPASNRETIEITRGQITITGNNQEFKFSREQVRSLGFDSLERFKDWLNIVTKGNTDQLARLCGNLQVALQDPLLTQTTGLLVRLLNYDSGAGQQLIGELISKNFDVNTLPDILKGAVATALAEETIDNLGNSKTCALALDLIDNLSALDNKHPLYGMLGDLKEMLAKKGITYPLTENQVNQTKSYVDFRMNPRKYRGEERANILRGFDEAFGTTSRDHVNLTRRMTERVEQIAASSVEEQAKYPPEMIENIEKGAEVFQADFENVYGKDTNDARELRGLTDRVKAAAGKIITAVNNYNNARSLNENGIRNTATETSPAQSSTEVSAPQSVADIIGVIKNAIRTAREQLDTLLAGARAEIDDIEEQAEENKEFNKSIEDTIANVRATYDEIEQKALAAQIAIVEIEKYLENMSHSETPQNQEVVEFLQAIVNSLQAAAETLRVQVNDISIKMNAVEANPASEFATNAALSRIDIAREKIAALPTSIENLSVILTQYRLAPLFSATVVKDIQEALGPFLAILISEQIATAKLDDFIQRTIEKISTDELNQLLNKAAQEKLIDSLHPLAQVILRGFVTDSSKPLISFAAIKNELAKYLGADKFLEWIDEAMAAEIEKLSAADSVAMAGRYDELEPKSKAALTRKLERLLPNMSEDNLKKLAQHWSNLPQNIRDKLVIALVNLAQNNPDILAELPAPVKNLVLAKLTPQEPQEEAQPMVA